MSHYLPASFDNLPLVKWIKENYLLLAAIVLIRCFFLDWRSGDYQNALHNWMLFMREQGLGKVFGYAFANYSPFYMYILGIVDALFLYMKPVYTIKCVTFMGEAFAAFYAYRLLALQPLPQQRIPPMKAALWMLLTVSVVSNGPMIGQCDIWYTGLLLAMIYSVLTGRPKMALVFFGFSLALKPQPMFLLPLLLLWLVKGNMRWRDFWIIPAVYILTCVPAWLQGREALEPLVIYADQLHQNAINSAAANPYYYMFDNDPLEIKYIGMLITVGVAGLLVVLCLWQWSYQPRLWDTMLFATLVAGIIPFVMPGMHDRYFFVADVFSFLLACMRPRWFIIPILFQGASIMVTLDYQYPLLTTWWYFWDRIHYAIGMNAVAVILLLWLCYRDIWKPRLVPVPA